MRGVNRMSKQRIVRWYTISGTIATTIVAAISDAWYLRYDAYVAYMLHVFVYAAIGLGLGNVLGRLAAPGEDEDKESSKRRSIRSHALSGMATMVLVLALRQGWYLEYHHYAAFVLYLLAYAVFGLGIGYAYGRFFSPEGLNASQDTSN